ncbi:DUF6157 family protein [Herbiconiux sp. CPCC 203407]|uniref:DUF6157 family protein n=1 Tax=Herbiconiux oxytropis TaxID=2970915 RepID=A0AA41XEU9_9MICO|nr:DUF6157 family protein [Herbiconiux oxytropis]MCS5723030.1 DUF6157 family protein [Herbiconiux oxytropis]MCS5726901.1 DUF6157 family protein [Herbiconiux oxytropis]
MTLTSILPTLRATIPDPLLIDRWPEWTHPTTTDVVVSGVSLLRLVEICDTPCVHVAAAVIPGTHGRPSGLEQASVIVTRVTAISSVGTVELDADLERFFAKGQPCLRASPLGKRYGWGTHHDLEARVALYALGTADYDRLLNDPALIQKAAMRSSRA